MPSPSSIPSSSASLQPSSTDRGDQVVSPHNAAPTSLGQPTAPPVLPPFQAPNVNPLPSFLTADSDDDVPLAQLHAASLQHERTELSGNSASVQPRDNSTTQQLSQEHAVTPQPPIQNERGGSSCENETAQPTKPFVAGRLRVPRQPRVRTNPETLNCEQSLPEFIHDACMGLLEYSKHLSQAELEAVDSGRPKTITKNELVGLVSKAKKRKRNRITFFNSGDGKKLRLQVMNHPHIEGSLDIYCALCGQNRHTKFRGHRTKQKCGYCDVNLCVKVRHGFALSCWDWWHSAQKLELRVPTRRSQINKGNNVDGPQNQDNVEEAPALKRKRLAEPARAPEPE